MRKIAANYVVPVSSAPVKNGILVFNSNHILTEIIREPGTFKEQANVEFYNGVLIPGLINGMCLPPYHKGYFNEQKQHGVKACLHDGGIYNATNVNQSNITVLKNNIAHDKIFCPGNAMLKDSTLPDINTYQSIGTQHTNMSLFQILKFIQQTQETSFNALIKKVTLYPAMANNLIKLGSFETGKTPGVNLITNFNFETFCLRNTSTIVNLI